MKNWGSIEQYENLLRNVTFPKMYRFHSEPIGETIPDIKAGLRESFQNAGIQRKLLPGQRVAVAAGSRELDRMVDLVQETVKLIKECGGKPFIVPAMGSHGGATAEGQRAVLEHLGITEQSMDCPILSSMETVCVGKTMDNLDVHIDRNAFEADWILPINRVKPHTDFRGKYESGLLKMLAIGLGKQYGADICHKMGFPNMAHNVEEFGKTVLATGKILCFVAVVENTLHRCSRVEVVKPEDVLVREPILLEEARKLMPKLPFDKVDLIVVNQMGKDLSGTGMDTNVVGRSGPLGTFRPFAERIVVFSLTEKTNGNANGMGLADIASMRLFDAIDYGATYPNGITSNEPFPMRTPVILPTDKLAYLYGIKACVGMYPNPIRIVHIKDTLHVLDFFVSEALAKDYTSCCQGPYKPVFREDGNFLEYIPED